MIRYETTVGTKRLNTFSFDRITGAHDESNHCCSVGLNTETEKS